MAADPQAPPPPGAAPSADHIRRGDRGLKMGWFYALSVYLSRVAALTLFEVRLHNAERIPRTGAVILAASHQSFLDPWLVGLSILRRAAYLARDSLFRVPVLGFLIRRYDAVPVVRESSAARQSLDVCIQTLEKDRALVFFPEGTRSQDGRLQPVKRGISLIAKRSGAKILPILMRGTHKCWPRNRALPVPGQVHLYYGNAFQLDRTKSSDAFVEQLEGSYRELALAAGATEVLPVPSLADAAASGQAAPTNCEAPPERLEAATSPS